MKPLFIYLLLALGVILFFRFFIKRKKKERLEIFDYASEGRNIALSIVNCKKLHKELVKKIHPDRLNESQKDHADKLMQEINSSKYDFNQLIVLKSKIEEFLKT